MQYLIFLLLVAAMFAVGAFLMRFFMDRAIRQVIKAFREQNALDPVNAKAKSELGLKSSAETKFTDGLFKMRDYKPYIFDSMLQLTIIRETEDEKYYLSEQTLQTSNLSKFA